MGMSATSAFPFSCLAKRREQWNCCLVMDALERHVMETVYIYPLATLRKGYARRLYEARAASRASLDPVPGSASSCPHSPYPLADAG